jgi:hypothetical protein
MHREAVQIEHEAAALRRSEGMKASKGSKLQG